MVGLTRTSDGLAVWEDRFAAHVGDPFALQSAIADGIEGKLRGRLAPGGGRRAEQIATTAEVYGLYSRARSMLRTRDPDQASGAQNFFAGPLRSTPISRPPGRRWRQRFTCGRTNPAGAAELDRDARKAAVRALTLAPNLAEAQATLGLIDGDNTSESEAAMRRAVALDPSYAEAWNWLGNALMSESRYSEAKAAYERSVALDPLWFVAAQNLVSAAHSAGDGGHKDRLFSTLSTANAGDELTFHSGRS